ncbi:hypothetical protein [Rhodococcus sp. JS3073]|uniref:hypothetical protein n=1 Tax=Rhodococcus sp. JS3073 TaxID=3002901 RepID=UPI0022868B0C|nr:hypothetical protein [Rhodococcus sp. JS3073]WAM17006.1 hypothetical protein OYT95_10400 [Rhodococcus sp. JS3073]
MSLDGIAVRLVCCGADWPAIIRVSRFAVSAASEFAIVLISRPGPHRPTRLEGDGAGSGSDQTSLPHLGIKTNLFPVINELFVLETRFWFVSRRY